MRGSRALDQSGLCTAASEPDRAEPVHVSAVSCLTTASRLQWEELALALASLVKCKQKTQTSLGRFTTRRSEKVKHKHQMKDVVLLQSGCWKQLTSEESRFSLIFVEAARAQCGSDGTRGAVSDSPKNKLTRASMSGVIAN